MRAHVVFLAVASFVSPIGASAQSLGVPPDIVQTRDGGVIRGVIVESVPGERVVIRIAPGETRTVPADRVLYAGPTAGALDVPVHPREHERHRVRVTTSPDGGRVVFTSSDVGWLRRRDVSSLHGEVWTRWAPGGACRAPCEVILEEGHHRLAAALTERFWGRSAFVLDTDLAIHIEYASRLDVRIAGGLVMGGGLLAGLGVALVPAFDPDGIGDDYDASLAMVAAGLGTMALGFIVGGLLVGWNDHFQVRYDPPQAGR